MPGDSSRYPFKHHPETCAPDDMWGQVKRTVFGQPVPPDQIDLIIAAIESGLSLEPKDRLLDLCCGNGAVTGRIFAKCQGGLGVDYSDFLIEIANSRFAGRASEQYLLADAMDYVAAEARPEQFTKVLCYGAFPYFDDDTAFRLLMALHRRFTGVSRVLLGQLPDKTQLDAFYDGRARAPGVEHDPGGALGIWRTPAELAGLAERAGWSAYCERMPRSFYAAHYRFDAILTR